MATISGTSGSDTLTGTSGNDTLNGLGGNDMLVGSGGADFYDGGTGTDTLDLRTAAAGVTVRFANGTISGGFSGTFVNVERVLGSNAADSLIGAAGNQTLSSRGGDDTLAGGAGVDTLWGGAGADSFVFRETGTANADSIADFASGSDKIVLDASVMTALGASGTFAAGDARFVANSTGAAQDASDRVIFNTTTKQLYYDADGNGSATAVLIATLQTAATLVATDITVDNGMPAGAGQTITGTPVDDALVGGAGNDSINGLGGNDTLNGVEGNDSLDGGAGADSMVGGAGDDLYFVDNAGDVVVEEADRGFDTVNASVTYTLPQFVNHLTLTGSASIDGTGNDANNVLTGNNAANTLSGRLGADTLTGGGGNDRFLFSTAPDSANADRISDFVSAADKLVFDPSVFTNLGSNGAFAAADNRFHAGAGAVSGHDADDRVVYDTSTGHLYYDADGSGSTAAHLVAVLQGAPTLAATDIVVGAEAPDRPVYNVRTLRENGASANRVDIVFMGDGYTESQIATDYTDHVNALLTYMFDDSLLSQPFGRYESFFNVHVIDVISLESGADHPGISRDTALGASYSGRSLTVNNSIALTTLSDSLRGTDIQAEMRFVPVNDSTYGGTGGTFAVYAAANFWANEIALHEAGHSFAHLGDQYWTAGARYWGSELSNPDLTINPSGAKWSHWQGYEQPGIGTIGSYEGGGYHEYGIYRPSAVSKMQALGYAFDAVGREAFILDFYDLVDPLDGWLDNEQTLLDNDEFWVDTIDPAVIRVDWTINGTTYANLGERISLSSLGFGAGDYTVAARAYDSTDWVRVADRSTLEESVQWRAINGGPSGQVINGTSGADTLSGSAGNDTLNGLGGNDTLVGSGGSDFYDGGAGSDTLDLKATNVAVTVNFATGSISGSFSGNFVNIERVLSGNGADVLLGAAGAQTLSARGGDDTLAGAAGNDALWGGGGADVFVFREMGTANADSIGDFATGADKLHLDDAAFTAIGAMGNFTAADARFKANSSGTATDTNDRVVFNTSTGQLYYDADGSGSGAAQLIAAVQSGATVAATDIVVI